MDGTVTQEMVGSCAYTHWRGPCSLPNNYWQLTMALNRTEPVLDIAKVE